MTKPAVTDAELKNSLSRIMFMRRDHGAISVVLCYEVVFYYYWDALFGVHNVLDKTTGYVWKRKKELDQWDSKTYINITAEHIQQISSDMGGRPAPGGTNIIELDTLELQDMAWRLLMESAEKRQLELMTGRT